MDDFVVRRIPESEADTYRSLSVSPERLTMIKTREGALVPGVLGFALPKIARRPEGENENRFDVVMFTGMVFFVLRIRFSDVVEVKLVFDPRRCFGWLILLARAQKLGLSDAARPKEAMVVAINTEQFRLWLAGEYLVTALREGFLDQVSATFHIVLKALGIPLRGEVEENTLDLVKDLVQCCNQNLGGEGLLDIEDPAGMFQFLTSLTRRV